MLKTSISNYWRLKKRMPICDKLCKAWGTLIKLEVRTKQWKLNYWLSETAQEAHWQSHISQARVTRIRWSFKITVQEGLMGFLTLQRLTLITLMGGEEMLTKPHSRNPSANYQFRSHHVVQDLTTLNKKSIPNNQIILRQMLHRKPHSYSQPEHRQRTIENQIVNLWTCQVLHTKTNLKTHFQTQAD